MTDPKKKKTRNGDGIAIGIVFGFMFGLIMNNVGLGLSLGVAAGALSDWWQKRARA
jgi:uncharacterized membrane protein